MEKRLAFKEEYIDGELFRQSQPFIDGEDIAPKLRAMAKSALKEVIANELTARQRDYLLLYYYEERSMAEIGEVFGVNVSTVSRVLARAEETIHRFLKYYFVRN